MKLASFIQNESHIICV